jgi:hypothetical protein
MKITRRQLNHIIISEIDASLALSAYGTVKAAGKIMKNPEAFVKKLSDIYHAGKGVKDVVQAKRQATLKFMQDLLSRALSRGLKRSKGNMSQEDIDKTHKAITSRDGEAILGSIKAGFLSLDLDDLQDVYKDLKKSASAVRVDFDAVEKMLKKLRDVV